ncbi:MAG: tetratricopeptide repeat protein [Thermoanaerobaculia bacterium]
MKKPVKKKLSPPDPPPLFSLALAVLRSSQGWTQKLLGHASGVPSSVVSDYERGQKNLNRERLEHLAAFLGFTPEDVEVLISFLRWFRPAPPGSVPVGLSPADVREIEHAAATVGQLATENARDHLTRALQAARAAEARRQAEEGWKTLKLYSPRERMSRVDHVAAFQTWAMCERLCAESVRAAAADARRAVELAELALRVAGRIAGEEPWRSRVQGYAWAHVGNARRVASQLPEADQAFDRAWKLWRASGGTDPDWLKEGRLLDLEASLRRDQRRLQESLELLDRALTLARTDSETSQALTQRAATLDQMGEYRLALEALERALPIVDETREPRQLFGLQFNRAVMLCRLGRHGEAADLLPAVRERAIALRNGPDLIRVRWLSGRVARGYGRRAEAIDALKEVRADFSALRLAYDSALASLELASLYLEEGRTGEVKALAREMAPIFKAQGVHKEARQALQLFRDAAEHETVNLDLTNRLVDYLERARHDPGLRFAA